MRLGGMIVLDPTWSAEISGDGGASGVALGALVTPSALVASRALASYLLVVVQKALACEPRKRTETKWKFKTA